MSKKAMELVVNDDLGAAAIQERQPDARSGGVGLKLRAGRLVGDRAGHGAVRVQLDDDLGPPLDFQSIVDVGPSDIGREVLVAFDGDELRRPIALGFIRDPAASPTDVADPPPVGTVVADVDADRMVIEARREIVLQCGRARVTLSEDGRIAIRGTQVSSRASGVNRIKGGSIQLN
jgi:hypothetical protein